MLNESAASDDDKVRNNLSKPCVITMFHCRSRNISLWSWTCIMLPENDGDILLLLLGYYDTYSIKYTVEQSRRNFYYNR